jgi:hypothetical protein
MQAYVDRGTYAGASTIVARRGVVVHEGHNGLRDEDAGLRMTEDTIFRLYSMTEPIVCTALMTLFEGAIPAPRRSLGMYRPAPAPRSCRLTGRSPIRSGR